MRTILRIAYLTAFCVALMAFYNRGARAAAVDAESVLQSLGATLQVTGRPAWPPSPGDRVEVTLVPQVETAGPAVVSFGLPFGPGWLSDDQRVRVLAADGTELPAFSRPLVRWWIDGKPGTIRSVLVQFEIRVEGKTPQKVTVAWDKPRQQSRAAEVPVAETQVELKVDPPATHASKALSFVYRCPKVLAVLPARWLCDSLVVWQQAPAAANRAAPWFDEHLALHFDRSTWNISANQANFEAHLFDRPATYAKVYARYGEAKHLLAMLKAIDFYIQHLNPNGFFAIKPSNDVKYVYTEGAAVAYLLTGDDRYRKAIDLALKAWETHKAIEYAGRGFFTERHHAFGMLAYLHAFEITGEPKHLEKARRYFEAAYSMQVKPVDGKAPDGAWVHKAEHHGDGNGWTTSPWMSAFLTDAIWKYWMLAGDARAPASLAMYARFTQRHSIAPDGKMTHYMANSPGRGRSEDANREHNVEGIYLLAIGHYLSGGKDPVFLRAIEKLWPPVMTDGANSPGRKFTWRFRETSMLVWLLQNTPAVNGPLAKARTDQAPVPSLSRPGKGAAGEEAVREVNPPGAPNAKHIMAVVGATLIDGRGGPPVRDAVVVIAGGRITAVGPRQSTPAPKDAEVVEAAGMTVVPGLLDAHFHIERDNDMPGLFLSHGVTALRDPGEWIRAYDTVRKGGKPAPRFFLTGPHLDCKPPAHPNSSFVVADAEETRRAVNGFLDEGASAIKVYYRLPEDLVRVACDAAHARGVPVTAHLELLDADKAILAGSDGIEHVTSFGTALAAPDVAQRFRDAVTRDNRARGPGRYELWSTLDLAGSVRVKPMLDLLVAKKTFLCPTLAVFEVRAGDREATEAKVRSYRNMLDFVRRCHAAGVTLVVGSHSEVPKAARGWAYQREMELLVECGLTPLEVLSAATRRNAEFFRVAQRLGTIEPGKLADLVLVEGDPAKDIGAMRKVKRVMLDGRWVAP